MIFNRLAQSPRRIYDTFIKDGRRLYRLLPEPLRKKFWLVLIVQFFSALIETCALFVISLFALSIAAPETALASPIVRACLSVIPGLREWCADPRRLVAFTSFLMSLFILFKVVLAALGARLTAVFAEDVSLHIGRETLRRYLNKGYFWHLSTQSQAVAGKFGQRAQLAQFLITLLSLYSNVLCSLALLTSLFLSYPGLTLFLATDFSLASLTTYLGLRRRLDRAGQAVRDLSLAETSSHLALNQGLREVLINRRQNALFAQMTRTIAQGRPHRAALSFYGHLPAMALELVGFGTISLLTLGMLIMGWPLPAIVSTVSLLMLTAWRVLPAITRTLHQAVSLRSLRPSAHSCLELLETFIAEEPEPLPEPDPNFRFERSITLIEAAFRYPGGRGDALAGLSLTIERGERIGLIGLSGAGKSTLALLLTGLVEPREGRFLADGRELSPAGRAAYVRLVGFVPQNPLLLPGTVAENVAFSRWGEPYDREEVAEACRRAALDFILAEPEGLERRLGSGGQGLSGGQAQRVAIARALFAKPQIIIFDEATSALDQASENLIAETVARLPAQTTVIVIAHRLTTVENCDRLIWLAGGRVRAEGPPAEILPLYKAAMASQTPRPHGTPVSQFRARA